MENVNLIYVKVAERLKSKLESEFSSEIIKFKVTKKGKYKIKFSSGEKTRIAPINKLGTRNMNGVAHEMNKLIS